MKQHEWGISIIANAVPNETKDKKFLGLRKSFPIQIYKACYFIGSDVCQIKQHFQFKLECFLQVLVIYLVLIELTCF